MHIVIATVGTRGDVQPYLALGKALVARGHRVSFATHEDHGPLVTSHGFELRATAGNFRDLMATPAGRAWLDSSDSISRYVKTLNDLFEPLAAEWLESFEASLSGADAVLVHAMGISPCIVLQHLKIPYVVIAPFGSVPSREFTSGLPRVPFLRPWIARVGHGWMLDKAWTIATPARQEYLAARGVADSATPLWRKQVERGIGHVCLISEHVVPRPKEWPAHVDLTGFCFLDGASEPSPALVDFVSSGPKPIYVGFGSMTGMEPEKLATLTRDALRKSGQRAVVAMGWGGMKGFEASDDVMIVDEVAHDWLFPRVAAVVHHCGAGTTAAALRAGRPSVGVPFFADQPFWAHRLAELGAAPPPIAKRKLTAERLAHAIEQATSNPAYTERAEALGVALRAEDGAARAAERVLHHLERFPA